MTPGQICIFLILGVSLVLFIWGKWRHDIVALGALFAAVITGVVPAEKAFSGFADPVVTTVAAILILSASIGRSGFIDWITWQLSHLSEKPAVLYTILLVLITACSGFMNNVGALAVFLPVALAVAKRTQRPPSDFLMPLAFASLLGGLVTLIGTPPNIIISGIRQELTGAPYKMFDFAPVGLGIALLGIVYLVLARRLLPGKRHGDPAPEDMFEIDGYVSEVFVPEKAAFIGKTLAAAEQSVDDDISVVGIVRDGRRSRGPSRRTVIAQNDTLLVEGKHEALKKFVDAGGLRITGNKQAGDGAASPDDIGTIEAIVMKGSELAGATPQELYLRSRHGINLLAISREGRPVRVTMSDARLKESDVILLQGTIAEMPETLSKLGCLPLAQRNVQFGRDKKFFLPVVIMAVCVALATFEVLPLSIAFLGGVLATAFFHILRAREMYEALDGSVIVLLAGLIPVTQALQSSGGGELLAGYLLNSLQGLSPPFVLASALVATMLITPFLSNAATVLLMAPVVASVAIRMGLNIDPFLMAVAVGASCEFLTPIGHQSNTIVMGPGGYKFGDYWKLGLPLTLLVAVLGPPLIMAVWPLH